MNNQDMKNSRPEEKNGTDNKPSRHRRRSHGRGNGKQNRPQNGENAQQRVPGTEGASAPAQQQQQKNNQNAQPRDGQKNGNGGKQHRNRNGRSKPFGKERGLYDPYEKLSREEEELADLRARIVIKSADGTAPVNPAAPLSPEKAPEADAPSEPLPEASLLPEESGKNDGAAEERVEIVGIRFRSSGKTFYFAPNGITAKPGDHVIVETVRGAEFGDVVIGNRMIRAKSTVSPLRPVLRMATDADIAHNEENRQKERSAFEIGQKKILEHKLDMKLVEVQYAFDNSKLLFYFTSEGRVDFRDLVKDLASVFRTRIELRQIGIRDEAKMLGGIGACGRMLCCSTFLPSLTQNVTIKMAKEQNLSLNSVKISGVCGRLMCCLRYEADVYSEEIKKTPSPDTLVKTEDGVGTVISSNPLAGTVRVVLNDGQNAPPKQYHRDTVTVLGKAKKGKDNSDGQE